MSEPTSDIRIRVNGQERSVPRGTSIADLVRDSRLPADQVAVEVNRRLVRSAAYDRLLEEGDEVEIVTFVGGG
jgi:sulfur carrier protein